MSAWIRMISDAELEGEGAPGIDPGGVLKAGFDRARTPHGTLDNVMRVHSLRPATLHGHVTLYRAALHDDANVLAPWLQETIASYVSSLNACAYSFANHWANARHLIGDEARATDILSALRDDAPERAFDGLELALMRYARKLTLHPGRLKRRDVVALSDAGLDDGAILEANQIIGYFNYANRLLNGLGVTTEGDVVGYYAAGDAMCGPSGADVADGMNGTGGAGDGGR